MTPPLWPFIVAILLLLLAILPMWPYGFYMLLRVVVCGVSIYGATQAHQRGLIRWVWTLSVMAVLFNPLFPTHLTKEVWALIDLVAAILFVVIAATLRRSQSTFPSPFPGTANSVAQEVLDQAKPEERERSKFDATEFEQLKGYCQDVGLKLDKVTGGYVILAPSSMDPYRDQWIKKELQSRFRMKVTSQSNDATGWRSLGKVESPEGL